MQNMWKLPGNAHHTRIYSRIIVIQKITFQTAACLNPWRKTNILFLLGPLKQWHHPKHHKTSLRHPQFGHWVSQSWGFPNSLFLASNMGLAVRLGHALPCACATYCTCCPCSTCHVWFNTFNMVSIRIEMVPIFGNLSREKSVLMPIGACPSPFPTNKKYMKQRHNQQKHIIKITKKPSTNHAKPPEEHDENIGKPFPKSTPSTFFLPGLHRHGPLHLRITVLKAVSRPWAATLGLMQAWTCWLRIILLSKKVSQLTSKGQ